MIYIKKYFNLATLGVFVFAAMVVATVATGVYAYKVHRDNAINMELSKRMMAEKMAEKVNSAIELEKKRCGVHGIAKLYIEKHPNVITERHKADLTKHEEIMLATTSHEEFDASNGVVNGIIEELKVLQQEYDAEQQRIKEEEERKARKAEEAKHQQQTQQPVSNRNGLTASSGVNYFGNRKETYYSSRVAYHHRTPEWWVDGEGFYRTAEGYYVVATSDMAYGTVFQGSKGACQVLDSGCAAGVTDYYVNW